MIVDSSAVVAIAFREHGAEHLVRALVGAETVGIAAPTWVETSMVLTASGLPDPAGFLERFGQEFRVESIPFTAEHARAAMEAWHRFGRGNHAARLNFGDCLSYAAATVAGQPLLFVGNDFAQTDIEPAISSAVT
jgi:ribonuclease VapC